MHFPFLQHLFVVCLCSMLWALGGVGAESKVWRMDWYSSQTGGLLLKAPFKPNVNRPLKTACRSLLNGKPTMWERLLNHRLAWSQTRLHSLEMLSVFECLFFWWIMLWWKMGSRFYLKLHISRQGKRNKTSRNESSNGSDEANKNGWWAISGQSTKLNGAIKLCGRVAQTD